MAEACKNCGAVNTVCARAYAAAAGLSPSSIDLLECEMRARRRAEDQLDVALDHVRCTLLASADAVSHVALRAERAEGARDRLQGIVQDLARRECEHLRWAPNSLGDFTEPVRCPEEREPAAWCLSCRARDGLKEEVAHA